MGNEQEKHINKSQKDIKANNPQENKEKDEIKFGYLIEYRNYENYKENESERNNTSLFSCGSNTKIRLRPEKVDMANLLERINNGAKFILIKEKQSKKICVQQDLNTSKIQYKITSENIILFINNEKIKFLKEEDNIIKYPSSKGINKICKDIMLYFDIDKKISEKLKSSDKEEFYGILLDNNWINEWKKYSYYDYIEQEYLENNDQNKIENIIMRKIQEKKLDYNKIEEKINDSIIKNPKDLTFKENSEKKFVIVTKEFLGSFTTIDIDQIHFILSEHHIEVEIPSESNLKFRSTSNII